MSLKYFAPLFSDNNFTTKKAYETLCFTAELDITAWARYVLVDERLKWDPEEYHNITDFRVPANEGVGS